MPTLVEHVRRHAAACCHVAGMPCPSWTDVQIQRALQEASGAGDGEKTALEEDPNAFAEMAADILYGIYGDKALEMLQAPSGGREVHESRLLEAWDPQHHPRGKNGRFIKKGSGEAIAAAQEAIGKAMKGGHSPKDAAAIMNHLNILTVKQLAAIHREHGKKAPGRLRAQLVQAIQDSMAEAGKATAAKVAATPIKGMHKAVADGLRGVLGDKAEDASKEIGLNFNKYTIQAVLKKYAGLDDKEAMAKVPEVTEAMLSYLDAKGITRPDKSLYEVKPPAPPDSEAMKKEQENWKAERDKKNQEARDFAEKNYKKPPPADQTTSEEWIAIHTRKAMADVEKDMKKLREMDEKKKAIGNWRENPNYSEDMAALEKELDKPANRALLRKYRPDWMSKTVLPSADTALDEAGRTHQGLKYNWDSGYFSHYSGIGAKALAKRQETIKKAVEDPAHELPEKVAEEFLYESWLPKKYRDRETLKVQIGNHDSYMKTQQPYAEGMLKKALEHAGPQLEPLMKKAAAIPPEIAQTEQARTAAYEHMNKTRDTLVAFESPYRVGGEHSRHFEIPPDKQAEYDRLAWEHTKARNDYVAKDRTANETAVEQGQRWLESLLPEGGNADALIPDSPHLNDRGRAELAKANAFLQKAVGGSWGKMEAKHSALSGSNRAYCAGNDITTEPGESASVLIHEYGHLIEHQHNNTLGTLSKAFAMSEVERHGEKMEHMGSVYEANEIGAKDGFMNQYTGKFYAHDSSEVLSMGIQHLYDDAIGFYQKSPKHFEYTLAALHGLLT